MAKKAAKSSGRTSSSSTRKATGKRSAGRSGAVSARSSRGSSASSRSAARSSRAAHPLVDHDDIRRWAEQRGAVPTCVRGTGSRSDTGMIRLEFPRYGEEPELQPIIWDEWFEKFEEKCLALMVQEETTSGQKSNFNKLVSRQTAAGKSKPKVRAAR